jgi:hypothetical protein
MNTPTEIKEVQIAGETFRFAPLSMLQIEQLIDPQNAEQDYKSTRSRIWGTIHASLSNAAISEGAPVPALEDLKARHTLKTYLKLHQAALEASYLREPEPEPAAAAA